MLLNNVESDLKTRLEKEGIIQKELAGQIGVSLPSEQQTIQEGRLNYEIWVFIHRLNMADHAVCP